MCRLWGADYRLIVRHACKCGIQSYVHSSFSWYAFLADLGVDSYSLPLIVLIIWLSTHNLTSPGNIK